MFDIPEEKYNIETFFKKEWVVYFLYNENELVYVGKTGNLQTRIENHKRFKKFTTFNFIKVNSEEDAIFLESSFIRKYDPILNVQTNDWRKFKKIDVQELMFVKDIDFKDIKIIKDFVFVRKTSIKTINSIVNFIESK